MNEKPYREMNDSEITLAHADWELKVAEASGWPSAYFAACQVKAIVKEGNRRGLGLINHYPIQTA